MRAQEILLVTTLLAGACSGSSSSKNPEYSALKPNYVEGYKTGFEIPREIDALEVEIRRRIEQSLDCQEGTVFFQSEIGAFREMDLSATLNSVFLSDKPLCFPDKISSCTAVALQYEQGKMVNGFTVSGACVPTKAESALQDKGFSTKVDLSERLKERIVFE